MRIDCGDTTYNYGRSREHGSSVAQWSGTSRMAKQVEVDPDEEDGGDVPILQHRQARQNLRYFGVPYNNEQCEYYPATV